MDTFLLQDWITVQSPGGINVIQPASAWLDLGPYQDVVILLEIAQATGSNLSQFTLQTAPARDALLFANLYSHTSESSASPIVIPIQVGDTPALPIARWLRWQVVSPGTSWTVTFRVTVMANRQGSQST